MNTKTVVIITILLLVPVIVQSQDIPNNIQDARAKYTLVEYVKNCAFSICISRGFTSEEVKKEASATAYSYFIYSELDIDTCERIVSLTDKYLASRHYNKTSLDAKHTLKKCIDLYNSYELGCLVNKFIQKELRIEKKRSPNQVGYRFKYKF